MFNTLITFDHIIELAKFFQLFIIALALVRIANILNEKK